MLETVSLSAVRNQSRVKAATLPISIVVHAAAVASALLLSVWDVSFPAHPPDQLSVIPLLRPTAVPPPSGDGRPPAPSRPPQERLPQPPSARAENLAPAEIPDAIPEASAHVRDLVSDLASAGTVAESGGSGGVPGGVDGGVGDGEVIADAGMSAPLPVGGDVKAPVILHRVEPRYPQPMVTLRREGVVVLQCVIDRTGRVTQAEVLRSPHPLFDDAALDAVRQWRFGPGTLNGRSVDVVFMLTVNFQLN